MQDGPPDRFIDVKGNGHGQRGTESHALPADLVDNDSAHVCTPGFPKQWQARRAGPPCLLGITERLQRLRMLPVIERLQEKTSEIAETVSMLGARGRTRTGTALRPRDFKTVDWPIRTELPTAIVRCSNSFSRPALLAALFQIVPD